ncbi:TPA: korC [Enterobacter roggenkampii]|nr:korC [Enterobacter roggenkampii]
MNADTERYFSDLIEAKKFNGYTLVSGEDWQKPTVDEIQLVRGLISLTDSQLANRLAVNERTIRKWKSGQTSMVYTTWCCMCWLAGLGMPLDTIING